MKYFDTERGSVISAADLEKEYNALFAASETECKTFAEYICACAGKHGTLVPVVDTKKGVLNMNRYIVYWVGGARDGEMLGAFDDVGAAINFASEFEKNHESEFDALCGGVGISDTENENNIIEW